MVQRAFVVTNYNNAGLFRRTLALCFLFAESDCIALALPRFFNLGFRNLRFSQLNVRFSSLRGHFLRLCNLAGCLLFGFSVLANNMAAHGDAYPYKHGMSYLEPLKYPSDFAHFEYVNPDAPLGGWLRFPELGTFDNFNFMVDKGRRAFASEALGIRTFTTDSLMQSSYDEPASFYGRLADGVWIADDYKEFAFRIRPNARWHDGSPLTVDDVVFSFNHFRTKGNAGIRTALRDLAEVKKISPNEVYFAVREEAEGNPILPFAVAQFAIQSEQYWSTRDPTKTTIEPPLGSGPYKIKEFVLGRYLIYERVEDYWGDDVPAMRGRHNFKYLKCDYYRDESIMVESIKADVIDLRHEAVSKQWMTQYNFPAVTEGYFNRELVYLDRPWGMWWPIIWNVEKPPLDDIRVREALWNMHDYEWANRVLMYGLYDYAGSYFFNSPMAHQGLPSEAELALLRPLREQVPERVFTLPWQRPDSDGYGRNRERVKRALALFREAGFELVDGVMTNVATGKPLTLDFIFVSSFNLRKAMPFVEALNRIGITTTARAPEVSNWIYRMQSGNFEGGDALYIPSTTPGLALRNWFSSESADMAYSQNWMNIRNPAVDTLIQKVLAATNSTEFYAATRALDRVLLWNFYWIPDNGMPGYRLVHWDRFGKPDHTIALNQGEVWLDTWWWDQAKADRVAEGMARLDGD